MSSIITSNGYNAAELFEGQAQLYKLLFSFLTPMCLKWATELNIPTIIHKHGNPMTLPHLLSALNLPPSKNWMVPRLMRFLVHHGLFAIVRIHDDSDEGEQEVAYGLTPASELLVEGTEYCLSSTAMFTVFDGPEVVIKLGDWIHSGKENISPLETSLGVNFWDLIHGNPERFSGFNEAMASDSQMMNLALRDCKSVFEGIESIVDVGGGNGATGKIISQAFPELKYIVFDLPSVVADLEGNGNLSYVGGDMFQSIPQADAILLKWILHDWNDDECKKILKNCKDSISRKGKGGKVIIIDVVNINEEEDTNDMAQIKVLLDMSMVACCGGKERDAKEWKQLFTDSGFEDYKIFPQFGFRSIIQLYQ
ncbi:hypothetical protein PIB30_036056 [Stylosanthes scabra]|uniref:Uncharacterized protein n=1 Tax=Stylosanthes scabra TaxID=79078 RepID=A0ABU6QDX5_9FABA|nr:hypothetical protein [Stylosanthes scabra]